MRNVFTESTMILMIQKTLSIRFQKIFSPTYNTDSIIGLRTCLIQALVLNETLLF